MKQTSKLLEVLENNISDEELEYSKYLLESIDARERELLKYKNAFEILKDRLNFELVYVGTYCGDENWYLNSKSGIEITKEEYELLEELMKDARD